VVGHGIEAGTFSNGTLVNRPDMTLADARAARAGLATLARDVRSGLTDDADAFGEIFLTSYSLPSSAHGSALRAFSGMLSMSAYQAKVRNDVSFASEIAPNSSAFSFACAQCYITAAPSLGTSWAQAANYSNGTWSGLAGYTHDVTRLCVSTVKSSMSVAQQDYFYPIVTNSWIIHAGADPTAPSAYPWMTMDVSPARQPSVAAALPPAAGARRAQLVG
jgi:hypothetical protein